jgi:hypothetical protein
VNDTVQEALARVLHTYRDIEGRPVAHAAVVRYANTPFGNDLPPDKIESAYEWVQLACFVALAGRDFFTPETPCNSDVFLLYMQKLQTQEAAWRWTADVASARESPRLPAGLATQRMVGPDPRLL